tara:strand:- start:10179 stop:10892 length:714 start_codon:yes stop_codon:yes gene_type:complete
LTNQHKFRAKNYLKWILIIPCWVLVIGTTVAQTIDFEETEKESKIENFPNPKMALLISFAAPGLGHHYVDSDNWTRGKLHLAADVVLIASYFGLNARANRLEGSLNTLARSKAGINLANKGREFELAIASYDNLAEYNEFQLRARRWQNIIEDTPENNWNWESDESRFDFQNTRDRISNSKNQLPALLSLMVANRVLSGLNAFTRARDMAQHLPEASFSYLNEFGEPGITAHLRFSF